MAIKLSGEILPASNADYLSRAPVMMAGIISGYVEADNAYRSAHGLEPNNWNYPANIQLPDRFPLSDVFIAAAAFELASLLTVDEDAVLSDVLRKRSEEHLRRISAVTEPVGQAYANLLR